MLGVDKWEILAVLLMWLYCCLPAVVALAGEQGTDREPFLPAEVPAPLRRKRQALFLPAIQGAPGAGSHRGGRQGGSRAATVASRERGGGLGFATGGRGSPIEGDRRLQMVEGCKAGDWVLQKCPNQEGAVDSGVVGCKGWFESAEFAAVWET